MREPTAEMLGRGRFVEFLRDALKGRCCRGGSDGRGSEKNRTLFPDGGRSERIADGGGSERAGIGAPPNGAKNAVSRVGSSSWAFAAVDGVSDKFSSRLGPFDRARPNDEVAVGVVDDSGAGGTDEGQSG